MHKLKKKTLRKDYKLISNDNLTAKIKNSGIETWNELTKFTQKLPYGRNSNRTDFELVISEKKGSCSSKHAMLKKVAELNEIGNVKLILGIYRMNKNNTPNIGNALIQKSIEYIPEAHCYLKIKNKRTDFTTSNSNFEAIESSLIDELEILPEQVAKFKVDYHKEFIKKWILEQGITKKFDEIWSIREKCISNMAE